MRQGAGGEVWAHPEVVISIIESRISGADEPSAMSVRFATVAFHTVTWYCNHTQEILSRRPTTARDAPQSTKRRTWRLTPSISTEVSFSVLVITSIPTCRETRPTGHKRYTETGEGVKSP